MYRAYILFCLLALAGCATPIAPSGGQPVRTAPQVLTTLPQQGATQYDRREVRIEFDRYMNRGSAARALRIEPDFGIPYAVGWKRKSMVITFEKALPDSVTVIIRLGAEIADIDGNRIGQPFQLAFSTGTSVDSAGVDIATISFDKARGEPGMTVALFRESALDLQAVYMAESDTSGIVRFRNATPGQYIAVLMDDRNRNRRIDSGETHFTASDRVTVASDSVYLVGSLVYNVQDTISPSVLGVGLLSNTRMRVRFSEPIRLTGSSVVEVERDGRIIPSFWLYSDPADPTVAFASSREPLVQGASYMLKARSVADFSQNPLVDLSQPFIGSSQQDTTQLRIVRVPEVTVVLPGDSILYVFSKPIAGSVVLDSLIVIDGERAVRPWPDVQVVENRMYVHRVGGWRPGQSYQLRVWDPSKMRHESLPFRVLNTSELGGLEIVLDMSLNGKTVLIEVIDTDGQIIKRDEGRGPFIFSDLVPGDVSIRLWVDTNGNGRWDGGKLIPTLQTPEPVYIQRGIPITPRLTTAVRVGSFY
jgi:hypothetical protein